MGIDLQNNSLLTALAEDFKRSGYPQNPALNILLSYLIDKDFNFTQAAPQNAQVVFLAKFKSLQSNNDSNLFPLIMEWELPVEKSVMLDVLSSVSAAQFIQAKRSGNAIAEDKEYVENRLNQLLWQTNQANQSRIEIALEQDCILFIEQFWPQGKAWLESPARVALRKLKQIDIHAYKAYPVNFKGPGYDLQNNSFLSTLVENFKKSGYSKNPALNILLSRLVDKDFVLYTVENGVEVRFAEKKDAFFAAFKALQAQKDANILPLIFEYNLPIDLSDIEEALSSISAAAFIAECKEKEEKQNSIAKSNQKEKVKSDLTEWVSQAAIKVLGLKVSTSASNSSILIQAIKPAIQAKNMKLLGFIIPYLDTDAQILKDEANVSALRMAFELLLKLGDDYDLYIKRFGYIFKNDKVIRGKHLHFILDRRKGAIALLDFQKKNEGFSEEKEYIDIASPFVTHALLKGDMAFINSYGFNNAKPFVAQGDVIKALAKVASECHLEALQYMALQSCGKIWTAQEETKIIKQYNTFLTRKDLNQEKVTSFIYSYVFSFSRLDVIKQNYLKFWSNTSKNLASHELFIKHINDLTSNGTVNFDPSFIQFIKDHIEKIMNAAGELASVSPKEQDSFVHLYMESFAGLRIENVFVIKALYLQYAFSRIYLIQEPTFKKYTQGIEGLYSRYAAERIQALIVSPLAAYFVSDTPWLAPYVDWRANTASVPNATLLFNLILRALKAKIGMDDGLSTYIGYQVSSNIMFSDLETIRLLEAALQERNWKMFDEVVESKNPSLNLSPLFNFVMTLRKEDNSSAFSHIVDALNKFSSKGIQPTDEQKLALFDKFASMVVEQQTMPNKKETEMKEMDSRMQAFLEYKAIDGLKHSAPVASLLEQLKTRYQNTKNFNHRIKFRAYSREQKLFCITKLIAILAHKDPTLCQFTKQEIACLAEHSKTGALLRGLFPGIKDKNFNETVKKYIENEKEAKSEVPVSVSATANNNKM